MQIYLFLYDIEILLIIIVIICILNIDIPISHCNICNKGHRDISNSNRVICTLNISLFLIEISVLQNKEEIL